MPEANEDHQRGPQKPNWVDISTLAVLTITVIGVFWYACEAHKQNRLLNKNISEQIAVGRPVVLSHGIQPLKKSKDKNGRDLWVPTDSPTDKAVIFAVNFGKTVAVDMVVFGQLAIRRPEQPEPSDPRCDWRMGPPRDAQKTALAPANESVVPNAPNYFFLPVDFRSGDDLSEWKDGNNLYVVGCIYYSGLDGQCYYSDICTIWQNGTFQSQSCSTSRNEMRTRKCNADLSPKSTQDTNEHPPMTGGTGPMP